MKEIEINPTNEYHILRHFSDVSDDYIKTLIGKEYFYYDYHSSVFKKGTIDVKTVQEALTTKGSKFFKNINQLKNPEEVLQLIKKNFEAMPGEKIIWKNHLGQKEFSFVLNYPEAVGYKNLISIKDLTPEQQKRVQTVPRSNHVGENSVMIKVIDGIQKKPINTIVVNLVDVADLPFYLVMAFPGDGSSSPDFPNSKQSAKAYQQSLEYWNSHIFVE